MDALQLHRRVPRIDARDLEAARPERLDRRDPGASEADDQVRAVGERWSHLMSCWYSVNPIALQIAATIQKRRMIFVSDHAMSSKWWWIGAMRNTRLRNVWNEKTWMSTLSASSTKMAPRRSSSTSVFVMTAMPAIAPPNPSEP